MKISVGAVQFVPPTFALGLLWPYFWYLDPSQTIYVATSE